MQWSCIKNSTKRLSWSPQLQWFKWVRGLPLRMVPQKDTRSSWLAPKIKFVFSFSATLMEHFPRAKNWGTVPCEAVFNLIRKGAAWDIVLKEKAASSSMQGHCTCPRDPVVTCIYRAAWFSGNSLHVICSFSAPYMTLRKKRWEVEVIGQSPLGCADPLLKGSGQASKENSRAWATEGFAQVKWNNSHS